MFFHFLKILKVLCDTKLNQYFRFDNYFGFFNKNGFYIKKSEPEIQVLILFFTV
ncbi:hypothetical protein TRIP_D300020 [uncultured Paludibacter sp.]|uniref:Uncharacterized protein n=1 Tax=uncultured Paludibacter sp. TaxID=497635 RepID=A0A653AA95_9BACT|nr:hypothetical protein TRIP_D300020 [uncultured Paludibacter sp.]